MNNNINNISRLFVEKQLDIELAITLLPTQSHYLMNVLRKKIGDYVKFFNGTCGEWLGEIIDYHKKTGVRVILKQKLREQDMLKELCLIFAPIKHARLHFILEKATELGATRLVPVITDRTVVSNINVDKWKTIVMEASEQSDRLTIPVIEKVQKLDDFIFNWDINEPIVLCNENENETHIVKVIGQLNTKNIKSIMVGPEGGFASHELSKLLELPMIHSVSLGAQILRSETAVLSAITCMQMMRVLNG